MSEDNKLNQQPNISQKNEAEIAPVTSVGTWLMTFVVIWIPIVGFIMSIVWMTSAKDKSRANYFKAALIMNLIIMLVVVLFSCTMSVSVTPNIGTTANAIAQFLAI